MNNEEKYVNLVRFSQLVAHVKRNTCKEVCGEEARCKWFNNLTSPDSYSYNGVNHRICYKSYGEDQFYSTCLFVKNEMVNKLYHLLYSILEDPKT